MSQHQLSASKLQEIRDRAAQGGKIVARRAFGEAGPGREIDFQAFGLRVAAEAQERDCCRAQRRAFLGDGAAYNGWRQRAYFAEFEPVTDFLPVLCYL